MSEEGELKQAPITEPTSDLKPIRNAEYMKFKKRNAEKNAEKWREQKKAQQANWRKFQDAKAQRDAVPAGADQQANEQHTGDVSEKGETEQAPTTEPTYRPGKRVRSKRQKWGQKAQWRKDSSLS